MNPKPDTTDLQEVCGIWEARQDRASLVAEIQAILGHLSPSNALLALPKFRWRNIYSTNFDRLIEMSYRNSGIELNIVRSNFDFAGKRDDVPTLYKIHGCITQDISTGHQARMILTERDYDAVADYREAVFRSLSFDLVTADTLVIGQSLKDAHLRQMAKDAAKKAISSGTSGRVYVLSFERDDDRAMLMEQSGIRVCFASLEEFVYKLSLDSPDPLVASSTSPINGVLPTRLATACVDVSHASTLPSNPVRLFNGAAATYSDIKSGFTAERSDEIRAFKAQDSAKGFFTVFAGVAGVGKTTFARRILHKRAQDGFLCWEANMQFPLDVEGWLTVDENLRGSNRQGFLLIDDCTTQMSAVNALASKLGRLDRPHLRLVLTANSGLWRSRQKSSAFFKRGTTVWLSRLKEADLVNLINLVASQPRIHELVDPAFLLLSDRQRLERLRDRCSAEMFVCLKNIFGNDELDYILLHEYAELEQAEQDVYRHVAALQAMGARVHRQLVLRCLDIDAGQLEAMLVKLDGIVEEFDVSRDKGLYGWCVRHDVVAHIISSYKFARDDELYDLLVRIIEGLNPGVHMEIETARAICAQDWGIAKLNSDTDQVDLLRRVISVLPAERIPRRRLVKKFLDSGHLGEAAQTIKSARAVFAKDMIIDRYEVKMLLARARADNSLRIEDREAILQDALNKARKLVANHDVDGQNIRTLADVAVELAHMTGEVDLLGEALGLFRDAEDELLDPEIARLRMQYEQQDRNLRRGDPLSTQTSDEPDDQTIDLARH
ncbi:SIR2 family protein [Rhodococcus sp. ACPA1]|uniref:SIR2 family NAD-dependent protein deacylase n=1 Tax=Rhodococcus sp. ACPA1 TaxID=2028572 RepID=UPI00211C6C7C|nr:SIR2 family protein [Rhodococcus sp. ACPA1]